MIITDDHIIRKTLDAIASAKDCSYYRILPTGELKINNSFKSYVYLAYARGNWFASFGTRKGASMKIPEKGMDLFAYGHDSICIQTEKQEVDISNPVIPLDENTRIFLFAFSEKAYSGKAYDVIIADGSRYSTVLTTCVTKTEENRSFLVMALTAMIREYDPKAADDILKFWFRKNIAEDSENEAFHPNVFGNQDSSEADNQH